MESETRSVLIKRYPNRKLYSTEKSTYVTLDTVYALIKEGVVVKVVNSKTQEDITTSTLLNAVAELGKQKFKSDLLEMLEVISNFVKDNDNGQETLEGGENV